jgi:hypothetical protein
MSELKKAKQLLNSYLALIKVTPTGESSNFLEDFSELLKTDVSY